MENWNELFHGFDERMKNLSVFQPLLQLQSKNRFKEYPLISLGMAVLLYILENMLSENKPTTNEELTYFLQKILEESHKEGITFQEADELRIVLVDRYLRNNGAPHTFSYYDFVNQKEQNFQFHYIEYDTYDIRELREKRVQLKLTTVGIEMLFKTKEMFNELQISISQLYFKQQMEKGLFDGALRTVRELSLQIRSEKQKMIELQGKIIKDAIEVSKKKELELQMKRVNEQTVRERTTFLELKHLVEDALHRYYKGELTKKEEKGIDTILQIDYRLTDVISLHESLFIEKQRLEKVMSESIEYLILNAFSVKLNFEKEVLGEIVRNHVGVESLGEVVRPFISLRIPHFFHPARMFEKQRRKKEKEEQEMFIPVIDEEILMEQERKERYEEEQLQREQRYLLKLLLQPLLTKESYTIKEILDTLREDDSNAYTRITKGLMLYSFLVTLHTAETKFEIIPTELLPFVEPIARLFHELTIENPEFTEIGYVSIDPNGESMTLESGYILANFTIQRGNSYVLGSN
ncbi:hypothetical protein [Bacillus cereus group sp. BfR-BA-01355]|uniref:hypothetical protein n=1 Tax=Bacillus cereus group sp. BfR-BA-01355 TaxID=2920318 RepID=UPI001F593E88|nr:hypothetical protein [Bacillus cereus group sp. BfR-BA-01355]